MPSKSQSPSKKQPKILRKRKPDTSLEPLEKLEDVIPFSSLMCRKGEAIQLLSGTRMPSQFRFRERESERIADFLETCVRDEKKGVRFLMLTGAPGAGKSLCTHSLLAKHGCRIIKMNANVVRTLQDVQLLIGSELLGKIGEVSCTASKLVNLLEETKYDQVCVVYIEEIELLFRADPTPITEDFMKLFQKKGIRMILIGISNTIDTLLKSSNKFCFKMQEIENVIFSPYTALQLGEIMRDKLTEVQELTGIEIAFTDRLIRYASLKLETLKKGDFRVCLEFLKAVAQRLLDRPQQKQGTEEGEGKEKVQGKEQGETRQRLPAYHYEVQIGEINVVLGKMNISKDVVIDGLPHQQKMLLIAIYLFIRKTDALCVTPLELQPEVRWICDSLQLGYTKQLMTDGLAELEQYGLVELKQKPDGQKIMLKIPLDEVEHCFQQHFIFKKFFQ